MKNFSWNKANDLTEIENKSKLKTISTLFDKKAEENNTIDLNAYERGLIDMYDYLIERQQSIEVDKLKKQQ